MLQKKLGALLTQNLDVKVIYTREDDSFIPLFKRAEIAHQSNGKLFISLHANAGASWSNWFLKHIYCVLEMG